MILRFSIKITIFNLFDRGSLFFLFENGFVLAVFPFADLSCAIFEYERANSMLFTGFVFSDELSTIWVHEFAEAIFLSVFPVAAVFGSIWPVVDAVTVFLAILPEAIVLFTVGPLKYTLSILLAVFIGSFIFLAIRQSVHSTPMLLIVNVISFVNRFVSEVADSVSVLFSLGECTNVVRSFGINHSSFALRLVAFPVSFIHFAVCLPDAMASAFSAFSDPMACVDVVVCFGSLSELHIAKFFARLERWVLIWS